MEKFIQILKTKIEDETAAFAILGAMIITFAITISAFEYVRYTEFAEVSSNLNYAQAESEDKVSKDYETLENVTSQEDLSKIEEENAKKDEEDEKDEPKQTSSNKYYIKVNYGTQVVNIYTKDSNGNYTVPVKAMVCSTGTHTPTYGVYNVGYKWEWLRMIGDVYGHYVTQINGNILFHSVPYLTKGDQSSLEYWAYDQLGTKASLGCVRLTTKDALWIFNNISSGTKVEFYSSSNPGPLGKPTAMKISSAPSYVRGWDPTDPDSRNPWPKYLKELEEKENTKDTNTEINNTHTNTIVNDVTNSITNDLTNNMTNDLTNNMTNDLTNNMTNDVTNSGVDNNTINDTTNSELENTVANEEDTYLNYETTT